MNRKQRFIRRYGEIVAAVILSSIAKVANAGRWGDEAKIKAERERHYQLIASLP